MEAAPDDMPDMSERALSTSPAVAAANSLFASAAEPAASSSPGAPAKAQPASSAWATTEHSGSALSLAGEDEAHVRGRRLPLQQCQQSLVAASSGDGRA